MLKVGVIVLGILPSGVKQIIHRLSEEFSPSHQLVGIELDNRTGKASYTELTDMSDSPYLSHSILKLSTATQDTNWDEVLSPMDVTVIVGNAEAKVLWEKTIAENESAQTLFVPVSIYNNIKGNDWTLGYDTALNSVVQNVLKVKDTIHSLKYDKPRLFGFSIEGNPSTNMLQDIAIAVDGTYLAADYVKEDITVLCETIKDSYTYTKTSNVLIYKEGLQEVIEQSVISELAVDWKYMEIDEALCMGINPTALDRILANELAQGILLWINNSNLTAELVVQKDGVIIKKIELS